ncbi:unnamed protein product, partial [Rotaria sp. Silwood2]
MCAYPECNAGQFHDPGLSLRREVTCIKCKRKICSFHGVIWHTGMTCDQYDQHQVEDIQSKNWISKNMKKCSQCQRNVEKNGGCNHITCTRPCGYQFCWKCLADYNRIVSMGSHEHR